MIVVVGAGATGLGVAWDLALRGAKVLVVEQGDIAHGTSGRFHGLLHSGARYAVRDPKAAAECIAENRILRRIAAGSVEPVGGFFVETGEGNAGYTQSWLQAMARVGIPARPVPDDELEAKVPLLNRTHGRAFAVPDGVLNGFSLLFRLAAAIRAHGGEIRTGTRLAAVEGGADGIERARLESALGSEWVDCEALVNASGPWAAEVSGLLRDPLPMRLGRGVMLIFAHRLVNHVVNRLAPPGDGDILVPHDRVAIWGTTDEPTTEPEALPPTLEEARRLMERGRDLFPAIGSWRVLRAFAGVRPLYRGDQDETEDRFLSRDFAVIAHGERGGWAHTYSVVGGKWATFRLMAERAGDRVARDLGLGAPSRTASTPLPPLPGKSGEGPWLCECEEVSAQDLARHPEATLAEWRTRTWFAMGPCQGTFCVHRVEAVRAQQVGYERAAAEGQGIRRERARGQEAALWGDNAREWALARAIRLQTLDGPR